MIKRLKINQDSLEEDAYGYMLKWYQLLQERKYEDSKQLCLKYTTGCKLVLKKSPWGEENQDYNKVLILAILFRGLQDFTYLEKIKNDKEWYKETKKVEYTWIIMLDCKDRIEFVRDQLRYKNELIEIVLDKISSLKMFFIEKFGDGKYLSPDILMKKSICNICNNDIRACHHVAGRLYNGVICYSIPSDDALITSVSTVKVPQDPRCRIWSWQIIGNEVKDACVLTSFAIDDFLRERDEKVGIFCSLSIKNIERFE
jgi:hypothetical protein